MKPTAALHKVLEKEAWVVVLRTGIPPAMRAITLDLRELTHQESPRLAISIPLSTLYQLRMMQA